jgi:hypothetical protein
MVIRRRDFFDILRSEHELRQAEDAAREERS